MSDTITNQLLLENLKEIQSKLTTMANEIGDIRTDIRGIKTHMAGFLQAEASQDGTIASIQARLDRLERRLQLQD